MTSKLESYSEVILPALADGRSYRAVANDLLLLGVEVSAQSIWSWHTRRMRRIERRRVKFSVAPVQAEATRAAPAQSDSALALPMPIPASGDPGSSALQALRCRIETEARQQEADPWKGLGSRFPVPR